MASKKGARKRPKPERHPGTSRVAAAKRKTGRMAADDTTVREDGLTDRQRLFVELYAVYLNGAEAARRAGYSEKNARQAAYENLTKPYIRAKVDERLDQLAMEKPEILGRLTRIASGSMADFVSFDEKGLASIDLAKARDLGVLDLVKKYKIGVQGISIELYDAKDAQVQLGRHHGLFKDIVEVEEPITIKIDR